ncbi:hypothetical protein GM418_04500 [Maribellus comscasis]|uniref:Uncharacterized protein n=2 Tax=Prolixibacteraceae TaxID=1471398 RepID=A0A6I6JTC7_9BACT|nr:hypothetical protein GM418_04500 [Maribellus comscasis]
MCSEIWHIIGTFTYVIKKRGEVMETHEKFKTEINQKLSEANAKIVDLRRRSKEKGNTDVKKDLSVILRHLESVRNNIMLQYEKIDKTQKKQDEFPELKKNIYRSFDSFEEAFSQAGSLVKPSKFRTRERSVDFNNPFGNR